MSNSRQNDAFNCIERKNSNSVILGLLGCTKVLGSCASFTVAAGCAASVLLSPLCIPFAQSGCELLKSAGNDFAAIRDKENDAPTNQYMQDGDRSDGYRSVPGGIRY
jgi:hypothetical protein